QPKNHAVQAERFFCSAGPRRLSLPITRANAGGDTALAKQDQGTQMKPLNELASMRLCAVGALMLASALLSPTTGYAQSAVVGALGNFDAANFEGKDAHGMEIQIEGIQPNDLSPSWCGNKYGCPAVVPYATGVYVRYMSPYDSVNH